MASQPNNSIQHFTHPGHQLTPLDGQNEFLCDGCKTLGTGKRYRCTTTGCDFDLHEYCATCPRSVTSFMHQNHALTLVMRKQQNARQLNRICDVCTEPVEGLFYRCKECEFDVHPLCTQLPEKLHHALDKIHPLILQSPPRIQGFCAVCRGGCTGWRYRCGVCNLDVHLECVLVPVVSGPENYAQTCQRGIPFQPPPQYAGYNYGVPYGPGHYNNNFGPGHYNNFAPGYYNNFRPGLGMQQGPYMYPNNLMGQNQVGGGSNNNGGGRRGKSMFALVGQLGFGVISNMIFGIDFVSLFSG